MAQTQEAFTLAELRRWFGREVSRANADFVRTQTATSLSLAQEWPEHRAMIDPAMLQVERLQIRFCLLSVRPPWYSRLWTALRRGTGQPVTPAPARYRFAAEREAGHALQFVCELRRSDGHAFAGEIERREDAATTT